MVAVAIIILPDIHIYKLNAVMMCYIWTGKHINYIPTFFLTYEQK